MISTDYGVQQQVIEKLLEAAIETRDELIAKKESEMRNLNLLAEALNGLINNKQQVDNLITKEQ